MLNQPDESRDDRLYSTSFLQLPVPSDPVEELLVRVGGTRAGDRRHNLCLELCREAQAAALAYRVAIALRLTHYENHLIVSPLYPEDHWPPSYTYTILQLDKPTSSACAVAYFSKQAYRVPNTSASGVSYFYVPSSDRLVDEMKSALAVPIRSGPHGVTYGVLHLDWVEPNALDNALVGGIERLTRLYASALERVLVDNDKKLDDLLRAKELKQELDLQELLEVFADATGADAGSLFLNRPGESWLYTLKASLLGGVATTKHKTYSPGKGLTGWVIQQNKPLLLSRLDDSNLLANLEPAPTWLSQVEDYGRNGESKPSKAENPFLAVPIALGSEVFGVIRLRRHSDRSFTVQDQTLLETYSRRLGQTIDEHRAKRREKIKFELSSAWLKCCGSEELLDLMASALAEEFGQCHLLVRGKEKTADSFQLVPLFASTDMVHDTFPRSLGEFESVSGWVLKHRRPRLVKDLRDPLEIKGLMNIPPNEPWRTSYGTPFLLGEFEGAFVFLEEVPNAFSDADVSFLEECSRMAEFGLTTLQALDRAKLGENLYQCAARYLFELLKPSVGEVGKLSERRPSSELKLYLDLLVEMQMILGADHYALAFPESMRKQFQLYRSDGEPLSHVQLDCDPVWKVPTLDAERIEVAFRGHSSRWIDQSNLKSVASEFFDEISDAEMNELTGEIREHRLLLIPLRSDDGLRAVLVLVVPKLCLLSYALVEHISGDVLTQIDKTLRLVDEYEKEREVAESGLVLSLLGAGIAYFQHKIRGGYALIRAATERTTNAKTLEEAQSFAGSGLKYLNKFDEHIKYLERFARGFSEDREKMDLVAVLRAAIREAMSMWAEQTATLVCTPELPNEPIWIKGYPRPLETAFHQLLENAGKAVERKGCDGRIWVRLLEDEHHAIVTVQDNGIGMDPETLKRIFTPFYSRSSSSGLGLPAARVVFHAHEAKIQPVSSLGDGTTFTVLFPRFLEK